LAWLGALGAANGEIDGRAAVGALPTDTDVEAASTIHAIVAGVSREFIVAAVATESVCPAAPRNLVVALAAQHAIAASPAENLITPAARTDQVVSPAALDLIRAASGNNDVATGCSPDLIGACSARNGCREPSTCGRSTSFGRGCGHCVEHSGSDRQGDDCHGSRHSLIRS
jgi:hypothetical protein